MKKSKSFNIKTTGKFQGHSNALGRGGRSRQLRAQGASGELIGYLARQAHAAPGMKNYHGGKKAKHMKKAKSAMNCKACKAMHKRHS